MPVVISGNAISDSDLSLAMAEYEEYIKVVVDVDLQILAAGGEWHSDAEKVLLDHGSSQKNLWGAGIDISTGTIDYISLINTRPNFNNSQEITDQDIRAKIQSVIRRVFEKYVK